MLYQYSSILFPLLIAVGVALALLYIFKHINKLGIDKKTYERLLVVMCYAGIAFYLGARFFDDLFHYLNGEPWGKGGITFLGGMISAMVVFIVLFLIFLKPLRRKFLVILNIIAVGIVIGHSVGRIGCFTAGCCYGKVTDAPIGVHFPGNYTINEKTLQISGSASDGYKTLFYGKLEELGFEDALIAGNKPLANYIFDQAKEYADTTKLLPTQLIETCFLLCLFTFFLFVKKCQFPLYVIIYGIYRFFAEFLRFDNRGATSFGISPSQLMSILIVVAGIGLLVAYILLNKKYGIEIEQKDIKIDENKNIPE